MGRSAGPPHPVGLARRSRRVVHAAVIAAAALVLSTAISRAQGDNGAPNPAAKVEKKQAEIDQQIQRAQDEAAERQAEVDEHAAHLQDEAAKNQADIDRKAAKLQDQTAKKQADIDRKAAKLQDQTAKKQADIDHKAADVQQQPGAGAPVTGPAPQVAPAATPTVASRPAPAVKHFVHEQAKLEDRRTKLAEHIVHDQQELAEHRAGLQRHIAHEEAKLEAKRTKLAEHIAREQEELARKRAEIARWLAQKIADLLNRRLGIHLTVGRPSVARPSAGRIPPEKFETAPEPKGAESKPGPVVVAAAPVAASANPVQPGTPAPPAVIQPDGRIPKSGSVPPPAPAATPAPATVAAPASGAVTPFVAAGGRSTGAKRGSGEGSTAVGGVPIPHKHRSPGEVVIHPLARAVAEIPKTVWVGMSGLVALALVLT